MELRNYVLALLIAIVLAVAFLSYIFYYPKGKGIGEVKNQTISLEGIGENKAFLTNEDVGIKFSKVNGYFKLEVVLPENVESHEVYDKIKLDLKSDKSEWNFTLPIWHPRFDERFKDALSLEFSSSDINEMEKLINESRARRVKLIIYLRIVDYSRSSSFINAPPLPLHEILLETEKSGKFSGLEEFSIYDANWVGKAQLFRDNNLIIEREIRI